MIRAGVATFLALSVAGATAAELPQRATKPDNSEPKARTCFIDGEPGVGTPGGGCVRVSGYISSQMSVGKLGH